MESDDPAASVYTNRPWRAAGSVGPGPASSVPVAGTGQRALDRMRVALRAYEQRAQRRAALRAWLTARGAETASARG